jgi:hypothetical protein
MIQSEPNARLSNPELDAEYQELLNGFSFLQLRYITARMETKSDKEAARLIDIDDKTPARWPEKKQIDRALELAARDGAVLALTMRRKVLPRAMAVKISALESDDEKVKQSASTELIEWELGKANQPTELSVAPDNLDAILAKVYGTKPNST